jgi:hypothetical protein
MPGLKKIVVLGRAGGRAMAQQSCYCGIKAVETQNAAYMVDGLACCTRHCYNRAVAAGAASLDRDGYMWGGPPGNERQPLP